MFMNELLFVSGIIKSKVQKDGLRQVTQGNRVFLEYRPNTFFIYSENGKYFFGKQFDYTPCCQCGQLVCHMMAGWRRHMAMHERQDRIEFGKDGSGTLPIK